MTGTGVMRETKGWTVDDSTFAARLALIRMRMGWNVKEAARETGQAAATWRLWEMDGATPRNHVQVAKQIAGVTGCDYLWLLLGPDRGEGGGDVGLNGRYNPLAERVIAAPASTTPRPLGRRAPGSTRPASPVSPTRRRAEAVRSPNRAELAAA